MSILYEPHRCVLLSDSSPIGSVFRCDDCGRHWLKYSHPHWRRIHWFGVWSRRQVGRIPPK